MVMVNQNLPLKDPTKSFHAPDATVQIQNSVTSTITMSINLDISAKAARGIGLLVEV